MTGQYMQHQAEISSPSTNVSCKADHAEMTSAKMDVNYEEHQAEIKPVSINVSYEEHQTEITPVSTHVNSLPNSDANRHSTIKVILFILKYRNAMEFVKESLT